MVKKFSVATLAVAIAVSLGVGGVIGFLAGVASTRFGSELLKGIVEQEEMAAVDKPQKLVRERFGLMYPSNWSVDTEDDDYDPDHMFSIESPGSAFVMFVLGDVETDPKKNIELQIAGFTRVFGSPTVTRFGSYGQFTGEGAQLSGALLGIKTTVRAFSMFKSGVTVMVVQQYPDEDLRYVKDGLALIERSFSLSE